MSTRYFRPLECKESARRASLASMRPNASGASLPPPDPRRVRRARAQRGGAAGTRAAQRSGTSCATCRTPPAEPSPRPCAAPPLYSLVGTTIPAIGTRLNVGQRRESEQSGGAGALPPLHTASSLSSDPIPLLSGRCALLPCKCYSHAYIFSDVNNALPHLYIFQVRTDSVRHIPCPHRTSYCD
jgi:hypothetical protein